MTKRLALIVAMDLNRVIGNKGEIPWRNRTDMQHFRETTMGHAVIMGSKTYDSLPNRAKPLPGRKNIVLTRNKNRRSEHKDLCFVNSFDEALKRAYEKDKMPFIIGGGEIYKMALDKVTDVFLTTIQEKHEGDTFFPEFPENIEWDYYPLHIDEELSIVHMEKR